MFRKLLSDVVRLLTVLGLIAVILPAPSIAMAQTQSAPAQAASTNAPILLIVNSSATNKFGPYLGEILRAEGLNAFDQVELSSLTAAQLAQYDVAILAQTSLNSTQASMFSTYVSGGGALLAMRPDTQINSLFGLNAGAGTRTNGYLQIQTSAVFNNATPGYGLNSATLQIHGDTDQYTLLPGAVMLAQLYSTATTSTPYAAVVGANSGNGQAVAFTYDLPSNVAYTRQGNPANADVDVDGDNYIRTVDLFQTIGNPNAPWVDRDKIPVPQADEQQRLFARLVTQLVGRNRPMPQLWYFPGTAKTMLILTSDSHWDTAGQYNNLITDVNNHQGKITVYLSNRAMLGAPTADWPSDTDLHTWVAQGDTFGLHPYRNPDSTLAAGFDATDSWFYTDYTVPRSNTVRIHRIEWQGWTDPADIEAAHHISMDFSFYRWGPWLQKPDGTWPHGYITGSGLPMKFVRTDGTLTSVYQQLTEMADDQLFTDQGGYEGLTGAQAVAISQSAIDASLAGNYSALTDIHHVDNYGDSNYPELATWLTGNIDYARSKGVPVWNADQWLSFTQTRHDANFSNIAWNAGSGVLSFTLTMTATPGITPTTILPLSYANKPLAAVTLDGVTYPFTLQTIKSTSVAFVSLPAGNHSVTATYAAGTPTVTSVSPTSNATNVSLTSNVVATFNEPISTTTINLSTFVLRDASNTILPATVTYDPASYSATLTPSAPFTYTARYTATLVGGASGIMDLFGTALVGNYVWSFTAAPPPPPPPTCPCTIWNNSVTPTNPAVSDDRPIEVGVKFTSDVDGYISGLRFYKGTANTGTHIGHLWSSTGTKLAEVTFTGETASGWQQVSLSNPVTVTAGTTYIASYYSNSGYFAFDGGYFTAGTDNYPLHALASGVSGPNGVYMYDASGFPTNGSSSNYWIDVVFTLAPGVNTSPAVIGTSPTNAATNVNPNTSISATFSKPLSTTTVNTATFTVVDASGNVIPATVSYNSSTSNATLQPNAPLIYSARYTATVRGGSFGVQDTSNTPMSSDYVWSFTIIAPPPTCPCSIWSSAAVPASPAVTDGNPIQVGVKFRSDYDGYITGLRFYKGSANVGTHTGYLWTSTGTQLASANFTNEASSGWQQVDFQTPVTITANTTYIASYASSSGYFALDGGYFANGVDNGPLHALASGVDGPNGVYDYSLTSFPSNGGSNNYWVDVIFNDAQNDMIAPSVTATSPVNGAIGVSVFGNVTAQFSEAINQTTLSTATFSLRDSTNTVVPTAVTYDSTAHVATLDPAATLAYSSVYTATIVGGSSGVKDIVGNALVNDYVWTFTTSAPPPPLNCPCSIWSNSTVPANPAITDNQPIEIGVKFRSDFDGFITGLRFYKGAANTGTHVGHLWSSSGTALAVITFTNETSAGWQEISLPTPVAIAANTTYIASYYSASGYFAFDGSYFTPNGVDTYPLHALASGVDGPNGVYRYGVGGGFPSNGTANNYWIDVVYRDSLADTLPPSVTSVTPAPGSINVAVQSTLTVQFSEPIDPATLSATTFIVRDASAAVLPATVAYDAASHSTTLAPAQPLDFSSVYTATLVGGSPGVKDLAGNALTTDDSWSFSTAPIPPFFVETSAADFRYGTLNSCSYVAGSPDGQVILAPTSGAEFSGFALPGDWTFSPWAAGGTANVSGGLLNVDDALAATTAYYPSGRSVEFVATFNALKQHAGFGTDLNTAMWAMFSTGSDGSTLLARSADGNGVEQNSPLGAGYLNAPHRYRIDWSASQIVYFIDGTPVETATLSIPVSLRPIASDSGNGFASLPIDWLRLSPYASTCTYDSRVIDAGQPVDWTTLTSTINTPDGTALAVSVRTGNTPMPDGTWSAFAALVSGSGSINATARYIQYRADLSTSDINATPALDDVTIHYVAPNRAPVAIGDAYSVNEDTVLSVTAPGVLNNDSDADLDPISAIKLSDPTHGQLTINTDGSFVYTPAANFNGTDSFTYRAIDGVLSSIATAVTLNVTPVNDAPMAADQAVATTANTGVAVTLGATDVDNDPLTYSIVSNPAHGTLSGTGANRGYTPNANYIGTDTFTFKANDGTVDSNIATVTVTVNAPVPTVTAIGPTSILEGEPGFTLVVTGTNFVSGAVVRWNGADRATTFVTGSRLTTNILANDIATAGTANVTVFNPAPGGGTSNGVTFTVTSNLIANGRVELDANGDGRPDSWTSNNRFTRSTAVVHGGTYAGRHNAPNNASYTISQIVSGITAGRTYQFSGWTNIPTTSDSFTYRLVLTWRNASGSTLRTDTVKTYTASTGGAWNSASGTYVAPTNAASVNVQMQVTSLNATIYADDFTLASVP
jgi:VCBS repeat-containing protein